VLRKIVPGERNFGQPLGYGALIERLGLAVPPPLHQSTMAPGARSSHTALDGTIRETFPAAFAKESADLAGHLVFALKYDGVDLLVLRAVFEKLGPKPLEQALAAAPTSAYLRRLWFFYEFLTGAQLATPDVSAGPYVPLLEAEAYVTRAGPKVRRQRIDFNLLSKRALFVDLADGEVAALEAAIAAAFADILTPPDQRGRD
jgi:hypothetical protein